MELQVQIVHQFLKVGEAASKPTEDSGIQLQLTPPTHWHCPPCSPTPSPPSYRAPPESKWPPAPGGGQGWSWPGSAASGQTAGCIG